MIRAGCGHASPLERKWWTGLVQPAWCWCSVPPGAVSYAGVVYHLVSYVGVVSHLVQ